MPERKRKISKESVKVNGQMPNNVIAIPSPSKKDPDYATVPVPPNSKKEDKFHVYMAEDYSLIGDRILKGDQVMIKENFELSEIKNDDLVISYTPKGRRVRHYQRKSDRTVCLSASNAEYEDEYFSHQDVEILGLICSVITFKFL